MSQKSEKGKQVSITRASGRPVYWVGGDRYTFVASTEETDGKFAVYENIIPPTHGAATHVHSRECESFIMQSGKLRVQVGEQSHYLEQGDFIHFPPGLAYSFVNEGEEAVRMLVVLVPSGLERFLAEVGSPEASAQDVQVPTSEDITRMIDGAKSYGITYLDRPHTSE
jgi:quercetin dioxygenase-like cupin family protein